MSDINARNEVQSSAATAEQQQSNIVDAAEYRRLKEKNRKLQRELQQTLCEGAASEMRAHLAEDAYDKLKLKTAALKLTLSNALEGFTTNNVDAAALEVHMQSLMKMREDVANLDNELEQTQTEIAKIKSADVHTSMFKKEPNIDSEASDEVEEMTPEIEERTDSYNEMQINIQNQLRHLDQKLELKKELHCKTTNQLLANTDCEVELLVTTVIAETTLYQSMEDTALIMKSMGELNAEASTASTPFLLRTIEELEEQLSIGQLQIKELQERVCAVDKQESCKNIWKEISNEQEAKVVIKQLFERLATKQKEFAQRTQHRSKSLEEQRTLKEAIVDAYKNLKIEFRLTENNLLEQLSKKEPVYEEKISVLLLELQKLPVANSNEVLTPQQLERLKIQEEQTAKIEELHRELDHYRSALSTLLNEQKAQESSNEKKKKVSKQTADKENQLDGPPKKLMKINEDAFMSDSSSASSFSDAAAVSDWIRTPLSKRMSRKGHMRNT